MGLEDIEDARTVGHSQESLLELGQQMSHVLQVAKIIGVELPKAIKFSRPHHQLQILDMELYDLTFALL